MDTMSTGSRQSSIKPRNDIEEINEAVAELCNAVQLMRDKMIERIRKADSNDQSSVSDSGTSNTVHAGTRPLRFNRGVLNLGVLQSLIGKVEVVEDGTNSFKLNLISSFTQRKGDPIELMAATSTGNIWICDKFSLQLVSEMGTVLFSKKLKFTPESLAVDCNDIVYFTCFKKKLVRRLPPFGEVENILNTSPLHPVGITVTQDSNILLSLMSSLQQNPKARQQREVVKAVLADDYSIKPEKFQIKEDPISFPYRVLENVNGDVIVIDGKSKSHGRIVAFTEQGAVKFIYGETESDNTNEQSFCPINMCRDFAGNILVIEGNSGSIHVLGSTGEFKRYIDVEPLGCGRPSSLSFGADGSLWVGHTSGKVTLHRYTADFDEETWDDYIPVTYETVVGDTSHENSDTDLDQGDSMATNDPDEDLESILQFQFDKEPDENEEVKSSESRATTDTYQSDEDNNHYAVTDMMRSQGSEGDLRQENAQNKTKDEATYYTNTGVITKHLVETAIKREESLKRRTKELEVTLTEEESNDINKTADALEEVMRRQNTRRKHYVETALSGILSARGSVIE